MIDNILHAVIEIIDLMGVIVIVYCATRSFITYLIGIFKSDIKFDRFHLGHSMGIALDFLMCAEILRTLTAVTFEELLKLGGIIILRGILALMIHFEIKSNTHD